MMKLSRRSFIQRTTGIAAAAFATPLLYPFAAATAAPSSKMRFGMVTYLWGQDWDLPTLIANCEKAGVAGVELRTEHKHGVEPSLNAQQREEVKKRFADSKVVCLGPGTNECYDSPDPDELNKRIERTKEFIILSRDIGASGVKVKPNAFHDGVPHEKTIEQIGKSLNIVGAFAADHGQRIRLEVHGSGTQELPVIKAIMDVADNPNVFVCWNSNDEDLKGQGIEYNFNLVKGRCGDTVHVRELNMGDYPYPELMTLFVKMDYAGWILLEGRTKPEDPIKALIEQREVFEKMIANAQA